MAVFNPGGNSPPRSLSAMLSISVSTLRFAKSIGAGKIPDYKSGAMVTVTS